MGAAAAYPMARAASHMLEKHGPGFQRAASHMLDRGKQDFSRTSSYMAQVSSPGPILQVACLGAFYVLRPLRKSACLYRRLRALASLLQSMQPSHARTRENCMLLPTCMLLPNCRQTVFCAVWYALAICGMS